MSLGTIRPRGDTAANWKTANPILKLRELAYEYEATVGVGEVNVKIGDGVTAWNSLGYAQKNMKSSDLSEAKILSLISSTDSYPVPNSGETIKVFMGKIKKFFEDIRNTTTGACFIGQIVNNCVTNNAKLPLSAAQGKVLMDLYTTLNSNLGGKISTLESNFNGTSSSDLNALLTNQKISSLLIRAFLSGVQNSPVSGSGICFSIKTDSNAYGSQLILSDRGVYARKYSGSVFSNWVLITTL